MNGTTIEHDFDRLANRMRKAGPGGIKKADSSMHQGALEMQRDAKHNAPKFQSLLTNSITLTKLGVLDYEITTGQRYAAAREFGTVAHWPNMYPDSDFYKWVMSVTGGGGARPDSTVFLMGRAISRRGTEPSHYMRDAFNQNIDQVTARISRTLGDGLTA